MFRELRLRKGLFQGELAEILGVERTTVVKWENGISFPRPEMLMKISEFFDVPIQDFYSVLKEKSN